MSVVAGQTIGSIVLGEKIAEGGMGSVWEAEHVTLHRSVIVKFLSEARCVEPEALLRFAMEGRTMARIQSPHVPQVFDQAECADGTPYIVMERIEGVHLADWVEQQGGRLSVEQVGRMIDHVGRALTAAHALGIVHRDVKPENIIVAGTQPEFTAMLIDFGIAKSTGLVPPPAVVTRTGATMGTASFMSPEQVRSSDEVDGRADVWSLAVVAYWCLTGELPFDGDTFAMVSLAIQVGEFKPVCELRPDIPAPLDAWFRAALRCDAAERFPSAPAMTRAFELAAARPLPVTRRMPQSVAYAGSAAAVLLLMSLGYALEPMLGISDAGPDRPRAQATAPVTQARGNVRAIVGEAIVPRGRPTSTPASSLRRDAP